MYRYIFSNGALKSCLCFDPSALVGSRIPRIADMNYAREDHSLIVASGKLYAIGGCAESLHIFIKMFVNLDFKTLTLEEIVLIQSKNTIHKRINGVKSEKLT